MSTSRSPETDAVLEGADIELAASDPPGGEHTVDEDVARKLVQQPDTDEVPLTTDESEQKSDSVIKPDNV